MIRHWDTGASTRWNEIARDLVAKHRTSAPMASRVYALVSVAQYDALVATWSDKYFFHRGSPSSDISELTVTVPAESELNYPSEHAAIAGASSAVLEYVYPEEAAFVRAQAVEAEESRLWAGATYRSNVVAGDTLGRKVAALATQRADKDGSAAAPNTSSGR